MTERTHYFDNAATSWPKPEAVYRFMDEFYRSHGVNPGRGGHVLAVEAEAMVAETRRMLAELFDFSGDPNRVAFTQNATDSLNVALQGLLGEGDHAVTTRVEHNSVLRPLAHLERGRGVSVTRVGRDAEGYVDPEDVRRAIGPRTRVVVINHGSNVLGAVQDLEAIGAIVRESDATLVVDTAQTAGVLPIEMDAWGIDVVTFTGHKGLLGPMGIGGIVVREGLDMPPLRVGGTGVHSIETYQPDAYPWRLEAGTVSIPGIAGLNAAQRWLAGVGREQAGEGGEALGHGAACRRALAHVEAVEVGHVRRLAEAFRGIGGVTVYGPQGNRARCATMAINVGALPAPQVGDMLDADHHVAVRAGLHCAPLVHADEGLVEREGAVRLSPGYFTGEEDIEAAIAGITEIASFA